LGTDALSAQRAESFRHFLLLPSPHSTPSLRSVAQGRLWLFTADASFRIFESALERVRRRFRLQVYGYVVMPDDVHLLLSEPQRDTSCNGTAPLKPKDGLNGPPVLSEPQGDTSSCRNAPLKPKGGLNGPPVFLLNEPQEDTSSCRNAPLKPKGGLNGPPVLRSYPINRLRSLQRLAGWWPTQARFWLEWGCSHVTDLVPANKVDCPDALGTDAFSARRAESFRHFLLLPSPHSTPSLRSVAQGRLWLFTTDASFRIFESALERVRRRFRLQVYGYVVMPEDVHLLLSEPQRDASGGRGAPLKPKGGLNGPPVLLLSEPQEDTSCCRGAPLKPKDGLSGDVHMSQT
jgi:REP element-mobilizing transposase RayT